MGHWYSKDGECFDCDLRQAKKDGLIPSVTTILSLIDKAVYPENGAAGFGRMIHECINLFYKGFDSHEIAPGSSIHAILDPTLEFLYNCGYRRGESELVVVGEKTAGTIDFKNKTKLVDFKTQSTKNGKFKRYKKWGYQLAAYRMLTGKRLNCEIVAISSKEPRTIQVFKYTKKEIDIYERYFKKILDVFYFEMGL